MQRGEQRYGREGRHFIQQQCGRQKGEREREIIACLRAAILSCAMNTKDTALELTPPPPNTHTSLALFAPPLKTQRNCRCPKLHTDISFTLCWKRLSSRPVPNPSVIIHIRPACAQTQPVRTNLLYWANFTGCLCNNLQNDLMWPYRDAKPNART